MIQQANTGQFLLSQNLQGQMQLVASSQPGQYVIQAGGQQGAYVVAQPQTTMVHGQPQTVLLAQTSQQQGTSAKTIIILQQQPAPSPSATHHQKVYSIDSLLIIKKRQKTFRKTRIFKGFLFKSLKNNFTHIQF